MNRKYRLLSLFLVVVLAFSLVGLAFADNEADSCAVVLYTNDVHSYVDDNLGYAALAAYKAEMIEQYGRANVTLVDCGDAIQGTVIGTLSKGAYLTDIMDFLGYDLAIPGNHEFDYGMENFLDLAAQTEYKYICCNFMDLAKNEPVFDAYEIIDYSTMKVAFVGMDTPEALTKSTPAYFQDADGKYIYGFCNGNDGQDLYDCVQAAVDSARAEGADYVVALAHLGTNEQSSPWRSTDVIKNTTGIDVVLDGHSHSTIAGEEVANKDGKAVLLTSTGNNLQAFGKLTITADGEFTSELITDYDKIDAETEAFVNEIKASFDDLLNSVVAKTAVDLTINDPATGKRMVRSQETNLGDLCADAYRTLLGADVAFVNGGGVRANIKAGDITYNDIINVHPFGNAACLVEVSGRQILDALELGAASCPGESGGFLQVSGLKYTITTSLPSTVVLDDSKSFVCVDGARRVSDVAVWNEAKGEYVALDPDATYKLASHNYMLKDGGDGYTMFGAKNVKILQDEVLIDNQVLINYIVDELGGVVGSDYSDPYGQGRITIRAFTDVAAGKWYTDVVNYAYDNGLMVGMGDGSFGASDTMTRAQYLTVMARIIGYDTEKNLPTTGTEWRQAAIALAEELGFKFEDINAPITREEMAAVAYGAMLRVMDKDGSTFKLVNEAKSFTDAADISAEYADAVSVMQQAGGINGYPEGNYLPKKTATRAEVCQIFYNLLEVVEVVGK